MSWFWGTSQIDEAVDKATSELLPVGSEDIALNLEICDQIRSKSTPPKDAMRALKRRLNQKNPNVQLLALQLTDICVKNGGDHFTVEITSREFIDNLVSILKMPMLNLDVKNMILRLIQNWGLAFEAKPTMAYVSQVYKTLQREGFNFPPRDTVSSSAAMVDTSTAPEWIDSDVCLRCRTAFTFTNRKHHCRNCGQVFDQQCSSKSMPLPHFGISVDVRVCDGCYNKLSRNKDKFEVPKSPQSHRHPSNASKHGHHGRSGRSLADEELQRAIELSLQDAGSGSSSGSYNSYSRPGYAPSYAVPTQYNAYSEPPIVNKSSRPAKEEEEDADLKAAIEASLKEAQVPKASAPPPATSVQPRAQYSTSSVPTPTPSAPVPAYDLTPLESDAILSFTQSVDQAQNTGLGSGVAKVNELYDKANSLRPKLAGALDDVGRKEEMLSTMNDKLGQVVKLYEQKMTEQVTLGWQARMARERMEQQQAQQAYYQQQHQQQQYAQPPQQQYGQPPVQWVQPQTTGAYQQPAPQQQYAPSAPTPAPVQAQGYASPPPQQPQWQQQPSAPAPEPSQPQYANATSPPPVHYQSTYPQQQVSPSAPGPSSSYSQPVQSPPPSMVPQQQQPYASAPTPTPGSSMYQPPSGPSSSYLPPAAVQSPPPPTPQSRHSVPAATFSPPPAQQSSAQFAPSVNGLARNRTISVPTQHLPQQQHHQLRQHSNLGRSNTVNAANRFSMPPTIPESMFPTAPTSGPDAMQAMYAGGMSVPNNVSSANGYAIPAGGGMGYGQQEVGKGREAALIDL